MASTLPTPEALDQMAVMDAEIKKLQQHMPQVWQIPEDKEPEELIKLMRAGLSKLPIPPPDPAVKESNSSYITHDGTSLNLYTFEPANRGDTPLPLLVWYHGGGGCVGSPESTAPFCRSVALEQNCIVIAPQYRLAPESEFPAQVDDSWSGPTAHRRARSRRDRRRPIPRLRDRRRERRRGDRCRAGSTSAR